LLDAFARRRARPPLPNDVPYAGTDTGTLDTIVDLVSGAFDFIDLGDSS